MYVVPTRYIHESTSVDSADYELTMFFWFYIKLSLSLQTLPITCAIRHLRRLKVLFILSISFIMFLIENE